VFHRRGRRASFLLTGFPYFRGRGPSRPAQQLHGVPIVRRPTEWEATGLDPEPFHSGPGATTGRKLKWPGAAGPVSPDRDNLSSTTTR